MVSTGLHCFLVILHFAVYACTSKKSQLQCALFVDDMQNCRRSVFCQPSSGWPSTFLLNLFCFEKYKVICNVDLWSFLKFLCVPICVVNPPPFFTPFCIPPTPAGCWLHNEYLSAWAEWEGKSKASKRKCHHQLPPGLSTRPGNHRFDLTCLYHILKYYTNLLCKQLLSKMSRAEYDPTYMTYIWFSVFD